MNTGKKNPILTKQIKFSFKKPKPATVKFLLTYLVVTLALRPLTQRFSESSGQQLQCPSRRRGWGYEESLVPQLVCQKLVAGSGFNAPFFLGPALCLGLFFSGFLTQCACMVFLFIACQLSIFSVVFVVPDLQGCTPVVTSSCPLWFVFAVAGPLISTCVGGFPQSFYFSVYAIGHSYCLLLLTISVNNTIAWN